MYFDGAPWGGQVGWVDTWNGGGNDGGGITVTQDGSSKTRWYQSVTGPWAGILQGQGAGFGQAEPGGYFWQTMATTDGNNSPGANFTVYDGLSGETVKIEQLISANVSKPEGVVRNDDTGITAVQIVGDHSILFAYLTKFFSFSN